MSQSNLSNPPSFWSKMQPMPWIELWLAYSLVVSMRRDLKFALFCLILYFYIKGAEMKVLFFKQEVRVPSNAYSRRNLMPFLLFTGPYLHIRLIAKVSQRCIEYRSLTKKHEKENTKRQKKDK